MECLISTPSVPNYNKKKPFYLSQITSKKDQLLSYVIMFFQKIIFSKGKLNAKCIQFALFFYFLYNQLPMKIVFTSSCKTYFKDNTKNYVTNYYVLVFLISVIFFPYNMGRNEYFRMGMIDYEMEDH